MRVIDKGKVRVKLDKGETQRLYEAAWILRRAGKHLESDELLELSAKVILATEGLSPEWVVSKSGDLVKALPEGSVGKGEGGSKPMPDVPPVNHLIAQAPQERVQTLPPYPDMPDPEPEKKTETRRSRMGM